MKLYEARALIKDVFESSFEKEKFRIFIKNLLKDIEEKTFTYTGNTIPRAFENYIRKLERIGKFEDDDGNVIDILIVELKREHSVEYARSTQRNFIRWYLAGSRGGQMKDAALVAFYSEKSSDWRFSFIKMQYSLETKKDELTPAKRFSFLVGEKGKSHTAQQQLVKLLKSDDTPTLADIEEAFNIETVTNEFFEKYKTLVFNLVDEIEKIIARDDTVRSEFEDKDVPVIDFAKKLMGQIVFLYFLQRKGWLGLQNGQKYGEGDRNFLRTLYNMKRPNENFFNDYLEYLFYDALSQKRVTDFYPRFNCRIPFLNGGLFDPINFYDWENTDILIPDELFTNTNKTKEGDIGDGILDIFDRYNFTVKEDEPLDKEVAVDPEMLGKVFERMLDVKERKSKGAFYTPREIVHYMSQESLIHYLDSILNGNITDSSNPKVPVEDIEFFIKHGDQFLENEEQVLRQGDETSTYKHKIPESIRKYARKIDQALENIRVCDPAVGSGAFPVGVMTEIVKTRQVLARFIDDGKNRSPYALKSHCIHHNLYGVDIDPSAVEICKLRLWLSLVVDEQRIDKIEPLPNLDYKIVKGNSLIGLPEDILPDDKLKREIKDLMEEYYAATDKDTKRKLKQKIDGKIREFLKFAEQITNYLIDFDFKLFFHEVFKEKGGFDVVIANPPYVLLQDVFRNDSELNYFKNNYNVSKYKVDLYHLFFEKAIHITAKNGVVVYISPTNYQTNNYAKELRTLIIKSGLNHIVNFIGPVFKASVDTSVTLIDKRKTNQISFYEGYLDTLENLKLTLKAKLPRDYFAIGDFLIVPPTNIKSGYIIEKIEKKSLKLNEIASINFGMQLRDRSKYPKDVLINPKPEEITKWHKPCYTGKDIKKYVVTFNNRYCYFNKTAKRGGCWDENVHFAKNKILVPQIGQFPISGIDFRGLPVLNTAFMIIPVKKNVSVFFLNAIINSSIISFYWRNRFNDNRQTFPKIKGTYLGYLPIIYHNKINYKPFKILILFLNFLKVHNSNKNKNLYIGFFEQVIDGMVFELYFEDEIKKARRDILKYLTNLTPITDDMNDEEKLEIITKTFNELYDKNHPVRQNLYYMDTIEEIRIIKGLS